MSFTDFDVDGGLDLDIFDINEEAGLNLIEGDIVLDETQTRNSIIGDEYRWPTTVPYYMEDDLEINAKGVILKAFEQYRLKTCIDFKPWSGEENYISIFKGSGCFSSVGNRRVGKQRLSIGTNCDRIATIEHEFLHALGFWHEQSRSDRDDYVQIIPNLCNLVEFDFVKCLKMTCFMNWRSGYFMHFGTGTASPGDTAVLESRLVYPKRGYQCLQFFYYNSAGPGDTLKIHVREYDEDNPSGKLRFIQTIDGSPQDLWQLHHVTLDVRKKFRVVFEGTKVGPGPAAGGLSLDDINLSETTCPEFVWRVKNFSHVMDSTPNNTPVFSPPFTSKEGYTFQMALYPNGRDGYPGELSAYAHLVAREGDAGQTWPCPWKQITMMLMDQHPHIQKRMSNQRSVTTDPNMKAADSDLFFWDDPRKVGAEVTEPDGSRYFRGPGAGTPVYLTHLRAKSRDFIKGGDAIFLLLWKNQDVSKTFLGLLNMEVLQKPGSSLRTFKTPYCVILFLLFPSHSLHRCEVGDDWWYYGDSCQHRGSTQDKTTLALASSLSVLGAMLLITVVSVLCIKNKYKKRVANTGIALENANAN
uniref:Metalloendopeptidase n=1 Tax=Fundulus heteroclitus TaxID=8078 RepID=A0A3Q2PJU2_FUNHE